MSRANFSQVIRGKLAWRQNGTDRTPLDVVVKSASETTSGTTRRKPKGKFIAPTAYDFNRRVVVNRYGKTTREAISTGSKNTYTGAVGGNSSAVFASDSNCQNAALSESALVVPQYMVDRALIKARLAMKQSDVNLGVAFAERNRTAQLVADTATDLVKSLRNLRRGNWRQAWKDLRSQGPKPIGRTIPQKWLEMQYGWKPLLSDVYGSVDALAKRDASDWRVTGKGSEREKLYGQASLKTDGVEHSFAEARGWRGCFVRIDAVPENDLLRALSSLGITNPAIIGWELVPFSFMVDWFLPIGNYLDSLDAMLGYGDTTCSISQFSRVEWIVKGYGFEQGNTRFTHDASPGTKEMVRLKRSVSASVPLPTRPRFRDGRSLTRMANALSILASSFR